MKSARDLIDSLRAYQPPNTDLGQHFLVDDELLNVMVKLAEVTSQDHVLEIGPGPGTLTQVLLETGATVTAIELDDGPVLHLDNVFSEQQNNGKLTLLHGDALLEQWPESITKIVANIPYQISSPLIEKITKFNALNETSLQSVVFMVQQEFAQRLTMAHPSDVGSLGMTVALDWNVEEHHVVAPHSFSPQPAVHSQVVSLYPHQTIWPADKRLIRMMIHQAFAERRKKIRSTLKRAPRRISRLKGWHAQRWKDSISSLLEEELMDLRPESLQLEDWVTLAVGVEKGSN
ncbi:MAG: ribosomal RNA small subunit methyltransferase A [Euryarchaeota archaeon TMED117]|nr:MAG: ribosomal RNA small subunit methyltransferase A [Euryarchaeota archaeon TMED117]